MISTQLAGSAVAIATALAAIAIASRRSAAAAQQLARGFWWVALAASSAAMLAGILSVSGALPASSLIRGGQQVLIYRGWIVAGTALASVALVAAGVNRPVVRAFAGSSDVLRGLRVSLALSFLATELGKLTHDAEMRQFFVESGYPVWFLYATISAETLGSLALLVSRRAVVPASLGLAVLMIGAIHTHAKNGDPFFASLEAVHLLVVLGCTAVLANLRGSR